jgi:DHA1 family bicyclomycin/chloramphenicol resistance-like MFS transporter
MKKNHIILVVYLAALVAFAPFSTDVYLSSMPVIQGIFKTSGAEIQLTLSLFFLGFAMAQLVWGPLSERIGRKAVVLLGVGIFVVSSVFCAMSYTIDMLIFWRVLQAIGACCGVVMGLVIIRDIFSDRQEMAKMITVMVSVTMVAPMVAPIIGSYVQAHINWEANFYVLALYGLVLFVGAFFLKESHPKAGRKPLPVNKLFQAYAQQVMHPSFLWAVLAMSANFSVMFAFISGSAFIYIKIYHLPIDRFGYFFALNACTLILASILLNRIRTRVRPQALVISGVSLSLVGSVAMMVALTVHGSSIWSVALPSFVATFGVGILYPEVTSYALHHVKEYVGVAAAFSGMMRFVVAAITALIMGFTIQQSAWPLAIAMLVFSVLAGGFMVGYFKTVQHGCPKQPE